MTKVLYGILNWNRPDSNVKKLINKFPTQKENIVVVTNQETPFSCGRIFPASPTVAASKNTILKYAVENNYEYCFIVEDDVKVVDNTAFQGYINLMDKYKYDVVMYGFDGLNRIINNKPNPCISLKISDYKNIIFNRYPCSSIIGFSLKNGPILFNEGLKTLELEFLLVEMKKQKRIPFIGFNIDLDDSFKYFSRTDDKRERNKEPENAQIDIDFIKEKICLDNNADMLVNYILERLKE